MCNSLVVVRYIKERSFKMSKCVLRNGFYLQHGILGLLLCCKPRGKVVSIETK